MKQQIEILGVKINNVSGETLVSTIRSGLDQFNQIKIFPVNPEMVMIAKRNSNFKITLNNSHLSLPDGVGIILASRILGNKIKERLAGVDAFNKIIEFANDRGLKTFLLGAAPGVAEIARDNLIKKFPQLQIVGTYAGSPREEEEIKIRTLINESGAEVLFVAYGAPKQELWIDRNVKDLNLKIVMSVGGTFDFIAETVKRAPMWIQKIGLEWFFRLLKEPWRWRRMLALPRFLIAIIKLRISMRY